MKDETNISNIDNTQTGNQMPFPLNVRKWIPKIEIDLNSGKYIRVMTYNILCDSLLSISTNIKESELNKMPYLKWEERRLKIINEISVLRPDIVCLQELEKDDFLINEFGRLNYDVISFFQKPRTKIKF